MATATPSSTKHLPTPSSHQSSTPHVTTAMTPNTFANHLAAGSPLPAMTATASGTLRSALSPASYPHPSKTGRSPFNISPDLMRHSQSSSSALHPALLVGFDSPSTAAGLGGPGGLNIAGLNGTPTATGIGAGAADTTFAAAAVNARDSEDEGRRRIEAIVNLLRQRPGMVSEEGVERLAKRTGLECLWEDAMGAEGEGIRTLSIAGNNVLVDVDFRGGRRVEKVGLSLPTCRMGPVGEFAEAGAQVLQRDLQVGKGEERGHKMLDPFADNLERLARLDKLSLEGANCFEAVAGVYASLRRVFAYEERRVREGGKQEVDVEVVEREVLCKRSGRPRMHARRRIGLNLEYWMERRLVRGSKRKAGKSDGDMDGAGKVGKPASEEDGDEESKTWSAVVECEASPAELYPSIRVSDSWVSIDVERSDENRDESLLTGDSALDWLDPPPTLTPSNPTGDAMEVDSSVAPDGKPPDVRFIARLEPPLVVPLQAAVDIYGSVGVTIPQDSIRPTTFEELLLPGLGLGSSTGHTEDGQLVMEKKVTAYDNEGVAIERKHKNTLYTQKTEFGRLVKDIPFSHPRQLVAILPVLRQWALVGSIVQRSFGGDVTDKRDNDSSSPAKDPPEQKPSTMTNGRNAAEELAALMADADADVPDTSTTMPVDFTLTTLPTPKIAVLFDLRGALATVTFEILPNAEIHASDVTCNAPTHGAANMEGSSGDVRPTVLMGADAAAKALAISEDVGVLLEWVRTKSFPAHHTSYDPRALKSDKPDLRDHSTLILTSQGDYCDVYLTHDSMSVRKAHNSGRNHLRNVVDYYQQIGHEKAQSVIDSITSSYAAEGQSSANPMLAQPRGPGAPFPPPPFGFGAGMPPPPFGMPMAMPMPMPGGPPLPGAAGFPPLPAGRGMPIPFPPPGGLPPTLPNGMPIPFPPPGGLPPNFQFPPPVGAFPPAVGAQGVGAGPGGFAVPPPGAGFGGGR